MAGLKVLVLLALVAQFNAQTIPDAKKVIAEATTECKVRTDATKYIDQKGKALKADLTGTKKDKALQFTKDENWALERETTGKQELVKWEFEVAMNADAFICFPEIHTPRKTDATADTVACATADEDYVEVKDEAGTSILTCCGTQCHKKTFKIVKQATDKTYTVTLHVQGKDKYTGFGATTFPVVGTLPGYDADLNKDVVRFQVSASVKTAAEEKAADEAATGSVMYKKITGCAKTGTVGNWKVYIYEKNAAADEAACKTACTGTDAASAKKCDFYIFKGADCWLGDFERGETTILAAATGLTQPVDINYKEPPLGEALPGYDDHKEECGTVGLFIKKAAKNEAAGSEAECAALCALGCLNECQTYKFDGAKCHNVNWAEADINNKYTPISLSETYKKAKANNLKALATAAVTSLSGVADNKANCDSTNAPGTAVIEANVASIDFGNTVDKFCILVTHQAKAGKKTTLTLPKSFGGTGSGFLKVFAGTISTNAKDGLQFPVNAVFDNSLNTALTAETTVEWTAPVATIVYKVATKAYDKDDGVKIEFEA